MRASDFAVCVRKLPAHQADAEAVKAHFSFFGPVASVAIAVENEPLMRLIRQQQQLKARWRLTLTPTPTPTPTLTPTLTLTLTLTPPQPQPRRDGGGSICSTRASCRCVT